MTMNMRWQHRAGYCGELPQDFRPDINMAEPAPAEI
jgi:hypothetical protein